MSSDTSTNANDKDVRLALLEQSIINVNDTLVRVERRFDMVDINIKDIRTHFDRLISGIYLIFGSSLLAIVIKYIH